MHGDENISFESGGHILTGILRLPSQNSAVPAVIILQGSEYSSPLNSNFLLRISDHLVKEGIACLIFNKRGVGDSSGNKWKNTFHDRALDSIAALDYLKTRKEIDSSKIGLFGHSQGGWICQLAASISDQIAFIINSAGPAESVFEQIVTDKKNHLILDGLSEKEIKRKIARLRFFLNIVLKTKPFLKFHPLSYFIDYDPKSVIERITCPVLALFGELDPLSPPDKNIPIFKEAFTKAGKSDFKIITFPEANHTFYLANTGSLKEITLKQFVPNYLNSITDWIDHICNK
jgi:uncharacterized protein